jgi:Ca-activated chloride channel family protein
MRSRNPTPAHQLHPFAGRAWRDLARFVGEALAAGLITSLVLALATFIVSTHAAAAPGARDDAPRGGLLLRSAPDAPPVPAPLLATDVRISVSGIVARATVRQRFHNPTAVWQEGVYVFPLPENAAVDHLEMRTGERVIEGVIRERAAARAEYEQAKAEGRKASLIEEQRPNVFTTRVAHLGPGEDIDITLEYQQTLRYDAGTFRLRFPMVVAPRYIPGSVVAAATAGTGWAEATDEVPDATEITPPVVPPAMGRINPVTLAVDLNPGFALARLESPTHAITVGEAADGRHRVELASAVAAASRDFELAWTPDCGSAPGAALFTEVRDGGVYALLMVNPPQAESGTPRAPREVVFVVDTSGSMEGTSIVQAREALQLALERLQPGDRFDVIEFNSSARALFGSPLPAEPATVARARAFVAGLKARGGTEMRPALELALKPGRSPGFVRQVVFLTDGAVGNESALFTLIRDRLGDRRLFTVGIGSAPNSHFMTKAAQFGRGSHTTIGDVREVAQRMGELLRKLESPVLTDIAITWPGRADVYPSQVPDLYVGEPIVVSAALESTDGEVVLRGRRDGQPWQARLPLAIDASEPGIGVLWARARIEALQDRLHEGAAESEIRPAIVDVALSHHLVSKYTSLVAVDVTPTLPAGANTATSALPTNLPDGMSYAAIFGGGPQTATPATLQLLAGLGALFAAAALGSLARRAAARRS